MISSLACPSDYGSHRPVRDHSTARHDPPRGKTSSVHVVSWLPLSAVRLGRQSSVSSYIKLYNCRCTGAGGAGWGGVCCCAKPAPAAAPPLARRPCTEPPDILETRGPGGNGARAAGATGPPPSRPVYPCILVLVYPVTGAATVQVSVHYESGCVGGFHTPGLGLKSRDGICEPFLAL